MSKAKSTHGKRQPNKTNKKPTKGVCPNFADLLSMNRFSSEGSKPILTDECAICENASRCLARFDMEANRPLEVKREN